MPSADIAMAHVLAYWVMGKVVANGGKTDFLDDDGIHSGLRRDFTRTDRGIERAAGRPTISEAACHAASRSRHGMT